MSDNSKIEWTDASWNAVTGCTKVSPGCDHCYAETFAERWRGTPGHHFEQGFDVKLWPDRLTIPLHWKRPRRIFVNSMSDLFHEAVPDEFIARMFAVMALAPQHTFQVLTKRHGRMRSLLSGGPRDAWVVPRHPSPFVQAVYEAARELAPQGTLLRWPLPNVWIGVSAEDQHWADIRIPALAETPASVRFVSAEPLLGPLNLTPWLPRLSWVIVGGESGPGARPMEEDWARVITWHCRTMNVPVFVKQMGSVLGRRISAGPKGGDWDAWPEDLRVREFPLAADLAGAA